MFREMKIITSLCDKIIFSIGVVICLQIPAFLVQYQQAIQGFEVALAEQITGIQKNADQFYQGSIRSLIDDYKQNGNPTVQGMAKHIENTLIRKRAVEQDRLYFSTHSFWQNMFYFLKNTKAGLIDSTLKAFKPSIPLDWHAFICGIIGGTLMSLLFNLVCYLIKLPFRTKKINELRFGE